VDQFFVIHFDYEMGNHKPSTSINEHLLTMEELNPKEHQIFFCRMGEYVTDGKFHHFHIPISLNNINQVADTVIEKVKAYAKNVYQESLMHYHHDNQYADKKKSEGYAKLITDQM
jgi:hypothetical protein